MTDSIYFDGLLNRERFTQQELYDSFKKGGYKFGEAAFRKKTVEMVKNGEIIKIGRNLYCMSDDRVSYSYEYSSRSNEVAELIKENYPYLDFTIFEFRQLNGFVNHLVAHNIIFLSVEADVVDFVFDTIKSEYPGMVLVNPSIEMFHQYWMDDMIVIGKLVTESPKGHDEKWHSRIEKFIVDIIAEPLLAGSISESEYPNIYENAFSQYIIDEKTMFRYAKRRGMYNKIVKMIKDKTNIKLTEEGK